MPYPYSSVTHPVTTSTTDFSYSTIDLLDNVPVKDQLTVYKDGQLITYGNAANQYQLNLTTEYVVLNTAISTGSIKIARVTDIENKEVTFTNSSVLTAQDLNKNSDQLLFLAQELYDKAQDISLTAVDGIPPNSIESSQLISDAGNEAVTTSVIRDDAVTTAKILDSSVTTSKINDLAVTTGKINDLAVTTGKIDDGAVTTVKISSGFYESGSWTPTYVFYQGGFNGAIVVPASITHAVQSGRWVRIGKLVTYHGRLGTAALSGNVIASNIYWSIAGLPTFSPTTPASDAGYVAYALGFNTSSPSNWPTTILYNPGMGVINPYGRTVATRSIANTTSEAFAAHTSGLRHDMIFGGTFITA